MSTPGQARRMVVVDDNDPSISYEGGAWTLVEDSFSQLGNAGSTHLATQHRSNVTGSIAAFRFQGDAVEVYGTSNLEFSEDGNEQDPTWECLVDGRDIRVSAPSRRGVNNWLLCEFQDIEMGEHELRVNVTSSRGQPFWLDYIVYSPEVDAKLENATVRIVDGDPGIIYHSGGDGDWQVRDAMHVAQSPGSSMKLNFEGESIRWFGQIRRDAPRDNAAATYSIDGGRPVSFNVSNPGAPGNLFNYVYFEADGIQRGSHTLEVIYEGGEGESPAPLTLDYLFITGWDGPVGGNIPAVLPSSSPQYPTPSPTSMVAEDETPMQWDSMTLSPGQIAGIILGTIGAMFLLVVLCSKLLRTYKHRKQPKKPPPRGQVLKNAISAPVGNPVSGAFGYPGLDPNTASSLSRSSQHLIGILTPNDTYSSYSAQSTPTLVVPPTDKSLHKKRSFIATPSPDPTVQHASALTLTQNVYTSTEDVEDPLGCI